MPLGRVEMEHLSEEGLTVGGHVEGHPVLTREDTFAELPQVLPIEGEGTRDEGIENDAQGPDIHLRTVVLPTLGRKREREI